MSQPLRIPCPHCRGLVSVELPQAGQTVPCRNCRKEFEVPTMRALKALAAANAASDEAHEAVPSGRTKSQFPSQPAHRGLFTLGLVLFVLFAAAGGGMLAWANSFVTRVPAARQAEIERLNQSTFSRIDSASMGEFWTIWHEEVLTRPPGVWVESTLVANRRSARFRRNLALGLFAVAGLGVAAMIGSVLVRK